MFRRANQRNAAARSILAVRSDAGVAKSVADAAEAGADDVEVGADVAEVRAEVAEVEENAAEVGLDVAVMFAAPDINAARSPTVGESKRRAARAATRISH